MIEILEKRKGPRMDPKYLPGRLRELREERGLTQEELAEKVGVGRVAVARWETGVREPGWTNILALCEALGVDCNEFTKAPGKKKGK